MVKRVKARETELGKERTKESKIENYAQSRGGSLEERESWGLGEKKTILEKEEPERENTKKEEATKWYCRQSGSQRQGRGRGQKTRRKGKREPTPESQHGGVPDRAGTGRHCEEAARRKRGVLRRGECGRGCTGGRLGACTGATGAFLEGTWKSTEGQRICKQQVRMLRNQRCLRNTRRFSVFSLYYTFWVSN